MGFFSLVKREWKRTRPRLQRDAERNRIVKPNVMQKIHSVCLVAKDRCAIKTKVSLCDAFDLYHAFIEYNINRVKTLIVVVTCFFI